MIEVTSQAEPIRGVKLARWYATLPGKLHPTYANFMPYMTGDEKATCQRKRMHHAHQGALPILGDAHYEHLAPHVYCHCGFYAWKPRLWEQCLVIRPGFLALDVELYGRVIEHQYGYRAEFQRVLRIGLFPSERGSRPWFAENYPTEVRVLNTTHQVERPWFSPAQLHYLLVEA